MGLLKQQRGMTAIGWLFVLVLVALLASVLIKLAPVYLEHFSVASSLKSLQDESLNGPGAIREAMERRLRVNNVSSVAADELSVVQQGGVYQVNLAYEVRVPFMGNLSLLVNFDDTVEVSAR